MSYIKELQLKHVKGLSGHFEFGPVTYIYGLNKTNKSTLIDAIKLALLGYFPKQFVPKTNVGSMWLASSSEMSVALSFADGRAVSRTFSQRAGSVSSGVSPAGFEVDPRLAVCLDPSLYFGKTESDRVQQVIEMSENLGDNKRVPMLMARFKILKLENHTDVVELKLQELLMQLPKFDGKELVQVWLARVLEWAKEKYKAANASAKNLESTNRTITEANAIDTLSNTDSKEELLAKLAQLRTSQLAITQEYGRAKALAEAAQNDQRRREKIVEQLNQLKAATMSPEEIAKIEAEANSLWTEKEKLEAEADEIPPKIAQLRIDHDAMVKRELEAHEVESKKLLEIIEGQTTQLSSLQSEIAQRDERLRGIQREINSLRQKIGEISAATCCPTCRTARTGWQAEAAAIYQRDIDALQTQESAVAKSREEFAQRSLDLQTAKANHNGTLAAARSKMTERQQVWNSEITTTTGALQSRLNELRGRARKLEQESMNRRQKVDELSRDLPKRFSLEEQLREIPEKVAGPLPEEPKELQEIKRELFEYDERLKVLNGQEQERRRLEEVQQLALATRAEVDLLKKIGETVKEEQAKIVADAFGPVLDLANQITVGIIDTPLVYRDGMVGREIPTFNVVARVATFSGSEERIAFAAISAALAQKAKDRIAIIDEIGTFDEAMRDRLLVNAKSVIGRNLLDQIFILGTSVPANLDPEITLIVT